MAFKGVLWDVPLGFRSFPRCLGDFDWKKLLIGFSSPSAFHIEHPR